MSIWDNSTTDGSLVRPGTPDIAIRLASNTPPTWVVRADGKQVYSTKVDYRAAHRWCQNEYGLTSTPMLAVCDDYEQALTTEPPPPPGPNRFRKGPRERTLTDFSMDVKTKVPDCNGFLQHHTKPEIAIHRLGKPLVIVPLDFSEQAVASAVQELLK